MSRHWTTIFTLLTVAIAGTAPLAQANTPQVNIFNGRYPANPAVSCLYCHSSTPALNAYGTAFKNSPAGPDSANGLAQIEFVDSDGDNFTNLHEILLNKLPGNNLSVPVNANTAPVLNAIGNKNLNEGATLNFTMTTTDDVTGLAPLLTVTNLPPGATFTDNRDRTGTFNWATDFSDGGVYSNIQFISNDGLLNDTETITIIVNDTNVAPFANGVENQAAYVGSLLEFDLTGFDTEGAPLTWSIQGLPAGASFTDNGDDTATFSWTPGTSDIGIYPNVVFTVEDDAQQTDSFTIAIFVSPPPELNFSDEVPLNTTADNDDIYDYSADLVTDGEGNWVAVWIDSGAGVILTARSSDNGVTWTAPAPVSAVDGGDEAPQIATDGTGNWVVVWRTNNTLGDTIGSDYDIVFARSEDNGATWSTPLPLNQDAVSESFVHIGANIETDGTAWVATYFKGNDLYAVRSADGGQTWGSEVFLGAAFVETFPDTPAARLDGDGAGNWVVVWCKGTQFSGAGTDVDVQVSRSSDGGQTWTPAAALNPNAGSDVGDDILPSVSTDGLGVWIAVWRSTENVGGAIGTDSDILTSRSLDNGVTWSAVSALSPDAPYDGFNWDYTPSLATDGLGTWVAMWHTNNASIRMSYSTDEGLSWTYPEVQNLLFDDTTRFPEAHPDGKGTWLATWETNEYPLDEAFDFEIMIARAYAPEIESIARNGSELTNAAAVEFVVTFDGAVFGIDTNDFEVKADKALTGSAVSGVVPGGPGEFLVTVSTGVGTGNLSLDFVDDGTVSNSAGNVPGGPGAGNGDVQGVEAYTVDKTKPIIIRNGSSVVNLTVGDPYEDAGATAADDLDGDLTARINTVNPVDRFTVSTYTVTYTVTDDAGNAANPVTRTVNVLAVPEGEGEGEGVVDGEGEGEGEGTPDGEGEGEGEGTPEGEGEGEVVDPEAYEQVLYRFSLADGGGDSLLTLAEIQSQVPGFLLSQFQTADKNNDGKLSVAELLSTIGGGVLMSADTNGDFVLSLAELLRLIQLYNVGEYACAANPGATEDGFEARPQEPGDPECLWNSVDTSGEGVLSLSELLRAIQFYNLGGYTYCEEQSHEDGFCGL
jgi:hypothetical protein